MRRIQLRKISWTTKTRKMIGIRRANLCLGHLIVTRRVVKAAHRSSKAGANARRNNAVMIPIAATVAVRVADVVDAGVADAVVVVGVIALTTVAARPISSRRSAHRGIINPRRFPPATIARNIRIRNRWPKSALSSATIVSARRIPSRTKTRVVKIRAGRNHPASMNAATNILTTATPHRWKPVNAARIHRSGRLKDSAMSRGNAEMNPGINAGLRANRVQVARRKITVRKRVANAPRVAINRRIIARKVVVSSRRAAVISKAIVRAVIVATDAVRHRVVEVVAIGNN